MRFRRALPDFVRAAVLAAFLPIAAMAASFDDPLDVLPAAPDLRPCGSALPDRPLGLSDVVDQALCRNPATASAWASVRAQAANVGSAQGAYWPTVNASASAAPSLERSESTGDRETSTSTSMSIDLLLFDFGGRRADLDAARAQLAAALATRDASLQGVYADAVAAWYDWAAAGGSLAAAQEAEAAAQASLDAAMARENAGTVTKADRLQAQTAHAQSQLARVQADGNLRLARGSLANAMGLAANARFELAAAVLGEPANDYAQAVDSLVDRALQARSDLRASRADVAAADAAIRSARASGRPRLSAFADESSTDSGDRSNQSGAVGVTLTIPIFTGFATTYRVRAAEAQADAARASLAQTQTNVSLDVVQAHSDLITQTQSVFTAKALVASAEESEGVARGRYGAGVGTILDLLNAQSAAADARQQLVIARTGWAVARTRLAQAVGTLDLAASPDVNLTP